MEYDLAGALDKVEKIKITSQYAKRLESIPSPFLYKPIEPLNGTIGCLHGVPIEVDDSIEENIEIIWKEANK
jgi:hypothetical protein